MYSNLKELSGILLEILRCALLKRLILPSHHFNLSTVMKRRLLSIDALPAWARINNVAFHDVEIKTLKAEDGFDKGSAVVSTCKRLAKGGEGGSYPHILITVPPDLVLSRRLVEECALTDMHLKEVLDAIGEYGMVSTSLVPILDLCYIPLDRCVPLQTGQ